MFENAANKVEDAWALLRGLVDVRDPLLFRATFNSLLVCMRSVPDAINREAKGLLRRDARYAADGKQLLATFTQWEAAKLKERREPDSLLLFVETARDEDVHEGRHRLEFPQTVHEGGGTINPQTDAPMPNTTLQMTPDGAYWLLDEGTHRARRLPFVPKQGSLTTVVNLANPPALHRGQALPPLDPRRLVFIAVDYYAELLFEARALIPDS